MIAKILICRAKPGVQQAHAMPRLDPRQRSRVASRHHGTSVVYKYRPFRTSTLRFITNTPPPHLRSPPRPTPPRSFQTTPAHPRAAPTKWLKLWSPKVTSRIRERRLWFRISTLLLCHRNVEATGHLRGISVVLHSGKGEVDCPVIPIRVRLPWHVYVYICPLRAA